jgi:hypothetical protein
MKPKVKIDITRWEYNCPDGCCTRYGTTTKVNGVEMPFENDDSETILQMVLEHLGYNVEIETNEDYG